MDIKQLKQLTIKEIAVIKNFKELEDFRVKYLGKSGKIADLLDKLQELSADERPEAGKEINLFKKELSKLVDDKISEFKEKTIDSKRWLDVTMPGAKLPTGHLHPRTILLRKIEQIFQSLGFSVADGPEIETDWYNFESLNFPKDHPAREMQDTFYLKNGLIPRTHTSPVQVRFMEKNNPPLRIIVPGRVFRNEATDASHDAQFYQVEGLMVDKHISVANFKAIIEEFFDKFYGRKVEIRLRPSFFPFTEPSFEVDIGCVFCGKRGCRVCGKAGWLEIAGAGMVNQAVFTSAGYARNEWQGFAFGIGFERILMMKYKIDDIRLLNLGDLRFLAQF